ncbi:MULTISPECIES: M16 family metallopeptidase [Sinorhizobium]|uniref:Zinc protease n=1 Tax=Sinorhizobium americanum TaxID=194963 RepID=A0A2S3YSZ1_9HYPH|nr:MULTISPECIES: pitrilysin family protein [Sinorhizobium]PDT36608.1 peptidase M16 [Sinorhizobium sp. FG01]PDT49931.1 peptidase M16 [Sinorhizobium sp. NG07B]POH33534.1 zinc protease [Sinorhizobium americanum]POH34751.1 zinc protease [Sinorhizobium americanum]
MTTLNRMLIESSKPLLAARILDVAASGRAAPAIQKIETTGGIKAWLVEDYSLPIITIGFAFEGGTTQDSSGKEGEVRLMTWLLGEGAGDLDSEAFQERLDDAGAEMRFRARRDAVYGSMRVLADQKDDAFDLLRLPVEQPRFDQAPLDRVRAQIVTSIIAGAKNPNVAAELAWKKTLYGDHPYSRRADGTEQTLAAITATDLKALHKRLFARGKLTIAVAGAIDASALKRDLDRIFGGLPTEPRLLPVAETAPKLGQEIHIPYDLPKTGLHLAYPGVSCKDPQFFAAHLMNHILGGGAFTSRLRKEVREKRGLTYNIRSQLVNSGHSSMLLIDTGTRPDRAAETLSIIRAEVRQMAEQGVSQEELEAAKKKLIGGYAIDNLNSSSAIVKTLVEIQERDDDTDHIERRKQLIDAVTVEDVGRVAKRLLCADPTVMIVGAPL